MWEPNEIRVLRWFMRFAGVGLMIPGVIYLLSWPDTVRAFEQALAAPLAAPAALVSIAGSLLGGLSFLLARHGRAGAVVAAIALLLGAVAHLQWSRMMQARIAMIPESASEEQVAMLTDTILFAANAQMPHALKNLVLVGMCAMFYALAPRLCGERVTGGKGAQEAPPPAASP